MILPFLAMIAIVMVVLPFMLLGTKSKKQKNDNREKRKIMKW